MIPLTLAEIARAVDGTAPGTAGPGLTVTGPVVIDSREVTAGALFAAIAGARSDGHDFAPAAYSAGAVAVLGSRPVDGPCVVVDDVVIALTKLAGLVRDRLSPVVIGLTGSVGKRADRQTRYLVLEMGAAKPGDITHLVRVGRPQIGMVLNVGPAHVLTMGGIDGVAQTKAEMVRDLPTAAGGGFALLNADDERVAAMARQTPATVTFYGIGHDAAVRARNVTPDAAGRASFSLHTPTEQAPVRLRLPGEHQVANALAAACAANAVGVPADRIATALSSAVPRSPGRFEIKERPDGVTVIDDAYNPPSRGHRRAGGRARHRRPRGGGQGRRTGRHGRRRARGRHVRARRAGWRCRDRSSPGIAAPCRCRPGQGLQHGGPVGRGGGARRAGAMSGSKDNYSVMPERARQA